MIKAFTLMSMLLLSLYWKENVCWSHTGVNETKHFCLLPRIAFCAAYNLLDGKVQRIKCKKMDIISTFEQ